MTSLLQKISDGYNFLFEDLADPRVKSFLFMSSPFSVIGIVAFYLFFIFKLGPYFMKNRPPFNLNRILVVYNIFQIVACLYLLYLNITLTLFKYSLICEPVDYSNTDEAIFIARGVWLYFILKLIDLMDTVFFILRKNNRQITFLHVYHHSGMCLLTWVGTKYVAGGHSILVGFLNNIVHVIMYAYYLLSAWDKGYKKNIWWKKYITQIQILQFVLIGIYFGQLPFQSNCAYPAWTAWYFLPQNVFMVILFTNFYIKAYVDPQKKLNIKNPTATAANGIVGRQEKKSQ